jgi:hypothetical protein
MQIVKIFPNNKNKCHFSIRKHQNKFFVFEGDKMLRTDLENINSAETEVSLIVLARKNRGVTKIPVTYQEGVVVNVLSEEVPYIEKHKCKNCDQPFLQTRSNRKKYCSKECSTKFNNKKRPTKNIPPMIKEDRKCVICNAQFTPSRSNHVCCNHKCSLVNYKTRKTQIEEEKLRKFAESSKNLQEIIPEIKEDLDRLLREPISKQSFVDLQEDDKTNGRESFGKGILDAYGNMGIVEPTKEALNEFHELTEKEMRLSLRKKKVEQFATDIVDYVVIWCELNEDRPFSYHSLFNELLNYKIVDLNKKTFVNVFAPVLTYEETILQVSGRFDLSDSENLFKLRNRLSETIFEENAIPTEEQYTKVALIRLMTSQLRFFLFERNRLKQEKPQPVSNAFDTAIFQGVLEMIQNLNNQNKIIGEKLDKCLEENKKFTQVQFQSNLSNNNDISDLKSLIENLRERVSEITKKRKGFFS